MCPGDILFRFRQLLIKTGQRYLPPLDETWKEKQIPASRAPVVDFRQYFSKEERINRVLLQQDRPDIRFITAVAGMTKRSVGSLFEIEDDCSSEVSVWLKSSLNAALLRLEKLTRRTQTPVFRHLYNLALVCNSVREWNEVVLAELSGKGIGRDVRGGPGATTNAVITLAEKMLQNEGVLAAAFSSVDSTDQNSMTFIVPGAAQIGGAANLVAVGTPIYLLEQTLRNVIGALNFYAVQPNKTGPVVGQVQSTLSQMVDVVLRPPYIGDVGLKYGDVYRLFDPKVSSDLVSNLVQLARTKRPALLDEDEYNDRLNSLGKYHHLAEALGAAARQFEKLRPELKRGTARLDDFFAELSQVIDAGDGAIEIAEKAQRSAIRCASGFCGGTLTHRQIISDSGISNGPSVQCDSAVQTRHSQSCARQIRLHAQSGGRHHVRRTHCCIHEVRKRRRHVHERGVDAEHRSRTHAAQVQIR